MNDQTKPGIEGEEQAPAQPMVLGSSGRAHTVSPVLYSAEEVLGQFQSLFATLDFRAELDGLGIKRHHFFRRQAAEKEFRALCVALWGLALQKSFPDDAQAFFTRFMDTAPTVAGEGKDARLMHERVLAYAEALAPERESDFTPVAGHMAEKLAPNAEELPKIRLKLCLIIRKLYEMIFNALV